MTVWTSGRGRQGDDVWERRVCRKSERSEKKKKMKWFNINKFKDINCLKYKRSIFIIVIINSNEKPRSSYGRNISLSESLAAPSGSPSLLGSIRPEVCGEIYGKKSECYDILWYFRQSFPFQRDGVVCRQTDPWRMKAPCDALLHRAPTFYLRRATAPTVLDLSDAHVGANPCSRFKSRVISLKPEK